MLFYDTYKGGGGKGCIVVCPTSNKHNNFIFIGVVVPLLLSPESKKKGTSEGEINPPF